MAVGIVLKVSPDTLMNKASQITTEISAIEREFQGLETVVTSSRQYWTGDASSKHQTYFREVKGDMQQVIRRLREHPDDLLKMAGLYQEGEAKAAEIAAVLPQDVIS